MEGNFLSRYNNKLDEWSELIKKDPTKRRTYESDMAQYIMKCMPYMNQHTDDGEEMTNTDNVFNVKETVGLQRRYIYRLLDKSRKEEYTETKRTNIYRAM